MTPDLRDERREFCARRIEVDDINGESVFGADRLAWPVGLHGSIVDPAGNLVVSRTRLSEMLLQEDQRFRVEIRACQDAESFHLDGRRGADTVEFLYGRIGGVER